jgi:hypothetical protein
MSDLNPTFQKGDLLYIMFSDISLLGIVYITEHYICIYTCEYMHIQVYIR